MDNPTSAPLPPRFAELKEEFTTSYPGFEARATKAWGEMLSELDEKTKEIVARGSSIVPEISFDELGSLSPERVKNIRDKGCLVIRGVVGDQEARTWQAWLRDYVSKNPVDGLPEDNKRLFHLYWSKSQVRARSHPNVLSATTWLNKMYHSKDGENIKGVDLETPLTYADRCRICKPGNWTGQPPHVDGGSIERWEDEAFRGYYHDILSGDWRSHDPYDLENRIRARSSLYGLPNQTTVYRTYQGWLALSDTGPNGATMQVFPDIVLSNVYMVLRPFFTPKEGARPDSFDPDDWKFDITSPEFPGIYSQGNGFVGPNLTTQTHPHLRLEQTMVSVPKLYPGDMIFWHGDAIHAVEGQHTGREDSIVMFIAATPYTASHAAYVERQRESFLAGIAPPDYPRHGGEAQNVGVGKADDIEGSIGRRAMGFPTGIEVA